MLFLFRAYLESPFRLATVQCLFNTLNKRVMASSTRKRNPNFSETELQILLKEVEKCKATENIKYSVLGGFFYLTKQIRKKKQNKFVRL